MPEEKQSFEASLKRLEEIVKELESTETPLEKALALFEEGTGLVRALTAQLDEATQKVSALDPASKSTETKPFSPENA